MPTWGASGNPTAVASEESRYLRFLYHPHLFPGMEPELRLAHELQFDLLPRELPDGYPLMVSAVLKSYCHLSGDLLGWRRSASGTGLIWVVDVSGHGVRSGLASAVIKILLDQAPEGLGPAQLLGWLDRSFRASRNPADRRSLYATGIVLEVEPTGAGRYASAGHQPALLRTEDGTVSTLPSTGPPARRRPGFRRRPPLHRRGVIRPASARLCACAAVRITAKEARRRLRGSPPPLSAAVLCCRRSTPGHQAARKRY